MEYLENEVAEKTKKPENKNGKKPEAPKFVFKGIARNGAVLEFNGETYIIGYGC